MPHGREEIADPEDPRLDLYRHLTDAEARRSLEAEHGVFVVEGATAIERLLRSAYRARSALLLPSQAERLGAGLAAADIPVFVASREVMAGIAGFDVHRGALALADRRPAPDTADLLVGARTVAVLEGLTDPENVGAIARTARGLGVDALLLDPACADPLYRRTVRVSMGEILFIPWGRLTPWPEQLAQVQRAGFTLVALTPSADAVDLDDAASSLCGPLALLFGTEGPGLSAAALAAADVRVRIPLRAGVDSLNVGHAAAIAFHRLTGARDRPPAAPR